MEKCVSTFWVHFSFLSLLTFNSSPSISDHYRADPIEDKRHPAVSIIARVIRQWFGNLVSPKSWKYLWLNEGFVHFFKSYILDKVNFPVDYLYL